MKLGANSVLFGGYDMATAFRCIKMAGYDGIEVSAIDGMSEHLVLDRWQECAPEIKKLAAEHELELLALIVGYSTSDGYEIVRDTVSRLISVSKTVAGSIPDPGFESAWRRCLHDGLLNGTRDRRSFARGFINL